MNVVEIPEVDLMPTPAVLKFVVKTSVYQVDRAWMLSLRVANGVIEPVLYLVACFIPCAAFHASSVPGLCRCTMPVVSLASASFAVLLPFIGPV